MSKNPVVPYILIFALGLGLIFFMSLYGLEQKAEIASEGEEGNTEDVADVAEFDADVAVGKCVACHGGDLTGGGGPSLHGLSMSKEEIVEILKNGKGMMPGNLLPAEHVDQMADYLLTLK